MNWKPLRAAPWLDTRAKFVAGIPRGGTLLDLGTSDGETLGHYAELRPDLKLVAVDLETHPDRYPQGCRVLQANLERDRLDLPDQSVDAITCNHLVEHLQDLTHLFREASRLLPPGGRAYFETPHPKSLTLSSTRGPDAGAFPMSFYDDPTHIRPVTTGALGQRAREAGLRVAASGISRNWLFALAYPLLYFTGASRQKYTAKLHFIGWSAYLIAARP